jgi:hypothetical protein
MDNVQKHNICIIINVKNSVIIVTATEIILIDNEPVNGEKEEN